MSMDRALLDKTLLNLFITARVSNRNPESDRHISWLERKIQVFKSPFGAGHSVRRVKYRGDSTAKTDIKPRTDRHGRPAFVGGIGGLKEISGRPGRPANLRS